MANNRLTTPEEDIYLELYVKEEKDYADAAEFLGLTIKQIHTLVHNRKKEGVLERGVLKLYTADEEKFIRDNYCWMSVSDIAISLNRTENSIKKKAQSLGVYQRKSLLLVDDSIRNLAKNGKTVAEIAEELKLNKNSLHRYLKKHQIEYVKDDRGKSFRKLEDLVHKEIKYAHSKNSK